MENNEEYDGEEEGYDESSDDEVTEEEGSEVEDKESDVPPDRPDIPDDVDSESDKRDSEHEDVTIAFGSTEDSESGEESEVIGGVEWDATDTDRKDTIFPDRADIPDRDDDDLTTEQTESKEQTTSVGDQEPGSVAEEITSEEHALRVGAGRTSRGPTPEELGFGGSAGGGGAGNEEMVEELRKMLEVLTIMNSNIQSMLVDGVKISF